MYGRTGLDRFKKAQSVEPFSVTVNNSASSRGPVQPQVLSSTRSQSSALQQQKQQVQNSDVNHKLIVGTEVTGSDISTQKVTQVGQGQSNWQPPDWAIEPRPGVYYLDVVKDGEVLDRINLDKRRHIFGRQIPTCDFVLDHQSVSRQHAAVVPHKNGSVYVIDMGSVHGTFVANERLSKENPVELEVGQSLRFAASTRSYILRKNNAALFPPPPPSLSEIDLPPLPDPCDEEAVLTYNTILNRYCIIKSEDKDGSRLLVERPRKRLRKLSVRFRDQFGGDLVEVVGISDGADVSTEPGPLGVKEGGSLVGKYESLVQSTVIPKGKERDTSSSTSTSSARGVTDKLQQILDKVKSGAKTGGIYDDLYGGDSLSSKVGSSWAYSSGTGNVQAKAMDDKTSSLGYDNDDLFGD